MPLTLRGMALGAFAAVVAACVASPPPAEPADGNTVSVRWEIRPETDSCGKLAGSVALFSLVGVEMSDALAGQVHGQLEARCPEDTVPESFEMLKVVIPESACGELRELLAIAHAFDVAALLDPAQARLAGDFMADLEVEINRRCPAFSPG